MGNPLAQKTFMARRAQKPSRAFIRYSDDGGKTFTAAQPGIRRLSSWECEKYGIRPIEYVDNSESAYTKTGILGSDDTVMELVTSVTDLIQNYSMMAGCRTFRPTKELYIGTYKTGGTVYAVGAFGNVFSKTFAIKEDAVFSYRLSSEGFCVDGKKVGGTPAYVPGSVPVNEIAVSSWNDNGAFSNRIRQKIYHARVKSESQGKETELFPAVNSEGVAGLFDRVERKFHVSDLKGKRYVKGGDVPPDDTFGTTPGEWMGVAFSDKGYPPFDVNEYTWSRTKGDPGKGVRSVVRYFGLSDSPAREPKSWSPVPATPTDEMPYLWSYDRITYTDGTVTDTTHAVAGAKGSQAEFHRLRAVAETAVVNTSNILMVLLSYEIEHVRGAQVTAVAGDRKGIHVTAHTSAGAEISMTAGARNEGHYEMQNYSKLLSRPDYIVVELKDGAGGTLDSRTVQITMEAASFVNVIGDVRETVSQHGRNISRIEQKADGISLKVEGMKNGVRNLLKGGRLNVSFSTYGLPSAFRLKLHPDTDYTLTVCGRISEDALKKGQTLHTYVFDKDWKWSSSFVIRSTSDTLASVTFSIPADRHSPEDYYVSCFPFPNQEPKGRNGEVTVSWLVLTEGTQTAASWIPAEGEDVEARMKSAGMEIKDGEITLTADRTKIRNNKDEDIAVFNEDGTVDARRILMRCRFGNITFGEVDGYPNIIITNALNQPMLMLNHRGIVSPYGADIVLLNCSEYFTRRDEAVLGVNIVVRVTNMGFQEQTFGDNIRLTATLGGGLNRTLTLVLGEYHVKGIAGPGIAVAAKQPVTLKIGETGTLVYGAHHTVGSTAGGNLVAQSVSFSVRATYADKVVDGSYTERLDASDGLPDFSGGLPGGGLPGGGNILSGL